MGLVGRFLFALCVTQAVSVSVQFSKQGVEQDVWLPIMLKGQKQYFNPKLNRVLLQPPEGSQVHMSLIQTKEDDSDDTDDDSDSEDDETPDKSSLSKAEVKAAAKVVLKRVMNQTVKAQELPEVQEKKRGTKKSNFAQVKQQPIHLDEQPKAAYMHPSVSSVVDRTAKNACLPTCNWACDSPHCDQTCVPDCDVPKCQTRCPKPEYNQCKIKCKSPHCALFCPKNYYANEDIYDKNITRPKCETRCEEPKCVLECAVPQKCHNVCQDPKCKWNCKNPKRCEQPKCRLKCEETAACYKSSYELPPLPAAHTVQEEFKATVNQFTMGGWSECNTNCQQTRSVACNLGDGKCGQLPETTRSCVGGQCAPKSPCHDWKESAWSKCDSGFQTRDVKCPCSDEKECVDTQPPTKQKCVVGKLADDDDDDDDDKKKCDMKCVAQVNGGKDHHQWNVVFTEGEYPKTSMEAHHAHNHLKKMVVEGNCCQVTLFRSENLSIDSGDATCHAVFTEGTYSWEDIKTRGLSHYPQSIRVELHTPEDDDHDVPNGLSRFHMPWWFWMILVAVPITLGLAYWAFVRGV